MIVPEILDCIKDNENCKSHGKDIYMQIIEYVSYDGDYDVDSNTFVYSPDGESYTDDGDLRWICGHCDRMIEWVVDHPQVRVE